MPGIFMPCGAHIQFFQILLLRNRYLDNVMKQEDRKVGGNPTLDGIVFPFWFAHLMERAHLSC